MTDDRLLNYIDGNWIASTAAEYLDVVNPATARKLASVPLSPGADVDSAGLDTPRGV